MLHVFLLYFFENSQSLYMSCWINFSDNVSWKPIGDLFFNCTLNGEVEIAEDMGNKRASYETWWKNLMQIQYTKNKKLVPFLIIYVAKGLVHSPEREREKAKSTRHEAWSNHNPFPSSLPPFRVLGTHSQMPITRQWVQVLNHIVGDVGSSYFSHHDTGWPQLAFCLQ